MSRQLKIGILLLALTSAKAVMAQGTLVEGVLRHTNGYLTIYPYSATYDDGTYIKAYYDGNNKRLMFMNSDAGTGYTGLMAGKIVAVDNVGIGTSNPQAKLAVNGNILANEIKIKTDITVPDYVFKPDYNLPALTEIEAHIKEHKHLPEIPSAADIQRDGLDVAEMNLLLLKKVEELTLHLIEKERQVQSMQAQLNQQAQAINEINSKLKD